jgi:hypothetical protein
MVMLLKSGVFFLVALPVFSLHELVQLNDIGVDDHLEQLALASHILAHVRVLLGLLLVDDLDGHLLAGDRVQALLDLGEGALAELASEQVVAHALVVRKAGDNLLGRDQEVGRYDNVVGRVEVAAPVAIAAAALLATAVYIIV